MAAQALFKQQSFPFVYIYDLIRMIPQYIFGLQTIVFINLMLTQYNLLIEKQLQKMSKTSQTSTFSKKVQISDAQPIINGRSKKSQFNKRDSSTTTKRSSSKSIEVAPQYKVGSSYPDLFWNYSVTTGDICNTALLKCFKQASLEVSSSTQEVISKNHSNDINFGNDIEQTQVEVLAFRKQQRARRRLKKQIKASQATHFDDAKNTIVGANYLKPPKQLEIVIEEKSPGTLPITVENLDIQGESFHFSSNREGSENDGNGQRDANLNMIQENEIPEVLSVNISYERTAAGFSPAQSFLSGQGIIRSNKDNSDLATAENSSNAAPLQNSAEKPFNKPGKYRYHKYTLQKINNKNEGVNVVTAKNNKIQLDPVYQKIQSPCFSLRNAEPSDLSSQESQQKKELIKELMPVIISPLSPTGSLSSHQKKANRLSQGIIEVPKFLAPLSDLPNTQENQDARINTQRQARVRVLASDRRSLDSGKMDFDVASGFGMESRDQSPRANNKLHDAPQQAAKLPITSSQFKHRQMISSSSISKAQANKNPLASHTSADWKKSLMNISKETTKNFQPDTLNQELHKLSQQHSPNLNTLRKLGPHQPAKTMSKFFSTQRNSIEKEEEDNQLKFPLQLNRVSQDEIDTVNINVAYPHQTSVKPPRKLSKLSPMKENCTVRKTLRNHQKQQQPYISNNVSQSPPQQLRYSRKYNPKKLKDKIQKAMENISSPVTTTAMQTVSENASSAGYSLNLPETNSQTQGLQGQGGCYHQEINKLLALPQKQAAPESSKQANSAIHNSRLLIIAEEEAHDNSVLSCSMFSVSQQSSHRNPCLEMNQTTANINSLFPDSNAHHQHHIEENKIQIKRFMTQKDRKLTKSLGEYKDNNGDINMSIEGDQKVDGVSKNIMNDDPEVKSHQKHYQLNSTYLEMSPEYIHQNCAEATKKIHFKKRKPTKNHKPSFQTSVKSSEASLTSSLPWQAIKNKKLKRELLNRIYQFAPNVTSHLSSTENIKQSPSVCKVSSGTKVITVTDIGGLSSSMLASCTNDGCKLSSNEQQKFLKPKTARIKTSHNTLKLQKLYKGQDGEWLGQMAGITKRKNKVGTSLRSKKVFQEIVRNVSKMITPRKPTTDLLSAYTSSVCSDTLSFLNYDISQHGYHNRYNHPPQEHLDSSQGDREASANDISVIQSVRRFKTLRRERGKVCSNSRKDSRSLFNNIDQIVHDLKESTRQLEQILIKEREHRGDYNSFRRPSSSNDSDPLMGSSCVLNITNKKVRYEESCGGQVQARNEEDDSDGGLEEDPDIDEIEDNVKIQ